MTKTDVMQKLQNYTYYKARLAEVKEKLDSMCYKTTATYGNLAPSTGGGFTRDESKLNILVFDGGYGNEYIIRIAEAFEAEYGE